MLSLGIFAGSVFVSGFRAIGTMRTVGSGLLLTGLFSLAIWLSTVALAHSPPAALFLVVGLALFVASIGNPVYAIANQTAVLEAADPSNRGSLMATRFGVVQTASIVGTAAGGFITAVFSPGAAYGVLGVGLIALALYAIAAGRRSNDSMDDDLYDETPLERAKI